MEGKDKLHVMRVLMKERGYDAYIIPHGDQHDNEYIAESDERIKFISNFSGSNGIGLVTQDIALMWTDGRYFIQIEKELYPGWQMKKLGEGEESLTQYISKNLPKNYTIAMDYSLFTQDRAETIKAKLIGYTFVDDKNNLIDDIWGTLKPKYGNSKVLILEEKFTGKSVLSKYKVLDMMLSTMINPKGNTKEEEEEEEGEKEPENYRLLISCLDDIAWFLNLRGNDIPYNPLFFSYALFCRKKGELFTQLFVNKEKFDTPEIKKYCEDNKIILFDYDEIIQELEKSDENLITFYEGGNTNHRMHETIYNLKQGTKKRLPFDLIEELKGIKNKVEIEGYRLANIKDSVALIKFFSWMEEELVTKNRTDLNEYQIGLKNKQVREDQENYMGESFAPICGCGANAAIIHYEQNENLHSDMNKNLIILCDTGAQYKEGTTDITRTVHYGNPTKKEKEMYTRVLLGNLSLERLIFKNGKKLKDLDAVPRSYLYMVAEDYQHGTSHGVGHFLNVHEGPYGLPLSPGNIITNEPGYYEKDNFGIRIENEVLVVVKDKEKNLLGFENLTFIPYERNLIDMDLISNDFKKYIDNFHKQCWDKLSPLLKDDQKALDYLKRKTAPL
jgi:Xaa-Pro aminopeptidase